MSLIELTEQVKDAVRQVLGSDLDLERFDLARAGDAGFGDFSTNAAMVYAKDLKRSPRELAEDLARALRKREDLFSSVTVAGPGFVNLTMADTAIGHMAVAAPGYRPNGYGGRVVVVEYSDPNPFKVLHAGHLYTSIIGDGIAKLIRVAGGQVHAVNFGGDVGLHVAKTIWAIERELGGNSQEGLAKIPADGRSTWMARCYIMGTQAYDEDEGAKSAIMDLNRRIYAIHEKDDHTSELAKVYWECRQWSYDYFEEFYARIGTTFEKYYPESETTPLGLEIVKRELDKGVYRMSDNAVVFDGEPYGLHTRVFITSQGLPTYEAKDVGLIAAKWRDYHFDLSVIVTASDIIEYMKVVLKSIEQFEPEMARRSQHITHGNVKLAGGEKMSSRKGNFLGANDVLGMAETAAKKVNAAADDDVVLGAVKYAFLKQRIGADIVYLPDESVSLEGNSGPYLQYAHARARSILHKAGEAAVSKELADFTEGERVLAIKIGEFPEVLQKAVDELLPHYICTYLYETAQVFNRFYENNRVVGDERQTLRLKLVELYADVLRSGLKILGISAPSHL